MHQARSLHVTVSNFTDHVHTPLYIQISTDARKVASIFENMNRRSRFLSIILTHLNGSNKHMANRTYRKVIQSAET